MPMEVISRVNQIGQAQGQSSCITFQDRHGHSVGDTNPKFSGVLPQLAVVVHDNDYDDISPDDDNIGTNPPDNIGIYPPDTTPIKQEDPRELEDEQPLAVNNEPTEVNPITSTSDTTIDNPSDRSVRRSNRTPNPIKDNDPSFSGKLYHSPAATTFNPKFTCATIHPDTHMLLSYGSGWYQVLHFNMTQLYMKTDMRRWGEKDIMLSSRNSLNFI